MCDNTDTKTIRKQKKQYKNKKERYENVRKFKPFRMSCRRLRVLLSMTGLTPVSTYTLSRTPKPIYTGRGACKPLRGLGGVSPYGAL